jgi:hypothetical protein
VDSSDKGNRLYEALNRAAVVGLGLLLLIVFGAIIDDNIPHFVLRLLAVPLAAILFLVVAMLVETNHVMYTPEGIWIPEELSVEERQAAQRRFDRLCWFQFISSVFFALAIIPIAALGFAIDLPWWCPFVIPLAWAALFTASLFVIHRVAPNLFSTMDDFS